MKLTTVTLPAVEMTREEQTALWQNYEGKTIEGKKIVHWLTDDGNNELRLEGESFYRIVTQKK